MPIPTVQVIGEHRLPGGTNLSPIGLLVQLVPEGSVLDDVDSSIRYTLRGVSEFVLPADGDFSAIAGGMHLVPNSLVEPAGTYYRVVWGFGSNRPLLVEQWQIPDGNPTVDVGALPTAPSTAPVDVLQLVMLSEIPTPSHAWDGKLFYITGPPGQLVAGITHIDGTPDFVVVAQGALP